MKARKAKFSPLKYGAIFFIYYLGNYINKSLQNIQILIIWKTKHDYCQSIKLKGQTITVCVQIYVCLSIDT